MSIYTVKSARSIWKFDSKACVFSRIYAALPLSLSPLPPV